MWPGSLPFLAHAGKYGAFSARWTGYWNGNVFSRILFLRFKAGKRIIIHARFGMVESGFSGAACAWHVYAFFDSPYQGWISAMKASLSGIGGYFFAES